MLKRKITDFHYGKPGIFLKTALFLPVLIYSFAIKTKNLLYKIGFLKEKRVNARVICFGNLTTGGTGKTPLVIEFANFLTGYGKRVAILSRGYGGKLDNKLVNIIRTYDKILIDNPVLSGDEADLISKKVKKAAVITCSDRIKGADFAIKSLSAEIILMDDGFSNRKIKKDLTFLLIDEEKLFGNGSLLPLGPLREPVFEIERADKIIFTNKGGKKSPEFENFISKLQKPYFECKMENTGVFNFKTGEELKEGTEIFAFCGIGRPEQFYQKLNFIIKDKLSFDDHVEYNEKNINLIKTKSKGYPLVTTEKDAVKLNGLDVFVLRLKPSINFKDLCNDELIL